MSPEVEYCRNGHARDAENLTTTSNGRRGCNACLRAKALRYKERRRAAGNPVLGGGGRRGTQAPQPPYAANVATRFWSKVDKLGPAECWEWVGGTRNAKGYGVFMISGWTKQAHRVAYELMVGPIPDGMTVDHRCLFKPCVNPAHFEIVTRGENGRRGNVEVRTYQRLTHCGRGHEIAGANEYVDRKGNRSCLACRRLRGRARFSADVAAELRAMEAQR